MGLRLKPDSVPILQARAAFYLAPLGFLAEAADDLCRAIKREPRSLTYLHSLGWVQYLQRDYAASVATMDRVLKSNRQLVPALFLRGLACERMGRHELAASAFTGEELRASHPLLPLRAEALYLARAGQRQQAAGVARKMEAMYIPGFLNALAIAEVFVVLEDHDSAFRWLETAYEDRRHRLIYLQSDPAWDPIRADRRFTLLAAAMGLGSSPARNSQR